MNITELENLSTELVIEEDKLIDPIVSENALTVLRNRYLAKDEQGRICETPKQMYIRVAKAIASAEKTVELQQKCFEIFYNLMATNTFMPNSPTIMNAGRRLGQLSACYVLPVNDNLEEIFDTVKAVALTQRAGGGTGFNFSNLRPNRSIVKSSGGTTAGPLSFIDVFSSATSTIQQGAFRRGANMGLLNCDHPDLVEFIKAKSDLNRWQNYNISVSVTDKFMKDLREQPDAGHYVHHKEWGEGTLWHNEKTEEVRAFRNDEINKIPNDFEVWTYKDTWNLICQRAWETGEPGLFFIDAVNKSNPILHLGKIEAVNPCGELPLHPWDSCVLGSINLSKFISLSNSKTVDYPDSYFNYKEFKKAIPDCIRFLDNVLDINKYPVPEMTEMSKKTRRIGLGVMGFSDVLFALGIPYNSPEGRSLASSISSCFNVEAKKASVKLAEEKGSFGAFVGSDYSSKKEPIRNSFRTTVAPTGTISIIADCSGGIEPAFALAFKREVMPDNSNQFTVMQEFNPHFKQMVERLEISDKEKENLLTYALEHGSIQNYPSNNYDIAYLKKIFVTSHDIDPDDHVEMQAIWQINIDNAVSKTINLRHDSTVEDVAKAYTKAYELGCKGITVYRDGSRENKAGMKQPMKLNKDNKEIVKEVINVPANSDFLPSVRSQIQTPWGNLHVNIVLDNNGKEYEIFAQLGKSGDAISADLEGLCRMASLYLRHGCSLEDIIEQWSGIGSSTIIPSPNGKITSIPDALAKVLTKYLAYKNKSSTKVEVKANYVDYQAMCPACAKAKLIMSEGCSKCMSCGFSQC